VSSKSEFYMAFPTAELVTQLLPAHYAVL